MAAKETSGISKSDFEDLLGALEDIAEAMSKSRAIETKPPVINVPAGPAPVVNAAPVSVKAPDVVVNAAPHPFATGVRVQVGRDRYGNANEYRFIPL